MKNMYWRPSMCPAPCQGLGCKDNAEIYNIQDHLNLGSNLALPHSNCESRQITLSLWASDFSCNQIRSDQSLSRVQLFGTPWIAARQASLSITNSWSSLRLTSIGVSDAIQPSHSLSSPSSPAPSPSQHQSLFQWVNSSHEVAKVLEFQL